MILSEIDQKNVIDKYLSGLTAKQVGELFNVSPNTILKVLKKHDIPRKNSNWTAKRRITDSQELIIIERYKKGETLESIGLDFDASFETIRRILIRHNVKRRENNGKTSRKIPKSDHVKIAKRYRDGETYQLIADSYGVCPTTIRRIVINPESFK
jgi:uncharacterized protein YjcR